MPYGNTGAFGPSAPEVLKAKALMLSGEVTITLRNNETGSSAGKFCVVAGGISMAEVKVIVFEYSDSSEWLRVIAKPFGSTSNGHSQIFAAALSDVQEISHGRDGSEVLDLRDIPRLRRNLAPNKDLGPLF